jgi:serine/threonine protein kinase/NTP pyrophosphatase (non-canonical NTP hydrolase)
LTECWKCQSAQPDNQRRCGECGVPLREGQDLRYEVQGTIGKSGGFGTTYIALDRRLENRQVALKLTNAGTEGEIASIQNEMRRLSEVNHPALMTMYDGDFDSGVIVMPLFHGNLRELIETEVDFVRDHMVELFSPLLEGLSAAHRANVLHRDIKPENILYWRSDDGSCRLVLSDFGVARRLSSSLPKTPIGTLQYMAPEVLTGSPYNESADLYSLGVTLYEALIGSWPIQFGPVGLVLLQKLNDLRDVFRSADGPPRLLALLERMTAPVGHRISSALQAAIEFSSLGNNGQVRSGSIDNDQTHFALMYGAKNDGRSGLWFATKALAHATAVCNLFKYLEADSQLSETESHDIDESLRSHIGWIYAWTLGSATQFKLRASTAIWSKYPARCPYCSGAYCTCVPVSLSEKNRVLNSIFGGTSLDVIEPNAFDSEYYCQMFDGMYGVMNAGLTSGEIAIRLLVELGEFITIAIRMDSLQEIDLSTLVGQELADVLAWLFALVTRLDVRLEDLMISRFRTACPVCDAAPCGCPNEAADLLGDEWRQIAMAIGVGRAGTVEVSSRGDGETE